MRRSLPLLCWVVVAACRTTPAPPPPLVPQTAGTIAIAGLAAPVRVVYDSVGVPHIYAGNRDDLFVAQGLVQAQDRLFQIDLWRRASQGRASEILGANFVDRDAMTRRIQYHGDVAAEWASYGPDAHAIAAAFVRGINAYVSLARERLPEEFRIAGWPPSYWVAEDLLNRTDAFVMSGGAVDAMRLAAFPEVVADAVRSIGAPPFLVGAAPPDSQTRARSGGRLAVPSPRYLIHLAAPGWNVIGATAPWRPGVVEGHTDRIAWETTPLDRTTRTIVAERLDRVTIGRGADFIRVKGRPAGITFTRETTDNGVIVATDRERNLVYVVRWPGSDPGGAAELGALTLDRARNAAEFREALRHWILPPRRFTFRDVDGQSGTADVPGVAPGGSRATASAAGGSGEAGIDPSATFAHVLGVGGRQRWNVGPVERPADDRQTQIDGDDRGWDQWRAVNAPGQSGSLASRHYADAVGPWSAGRTVELWFSEAAVAAHAEGTLRLIPRR